MYPKITGTTDLYLIAGDPVDQVRAPEVFNLIFQKLGIDAVLVPVHVSASDIETFVRSSFLAKNVKGVFLAIPHKTLLLNLLSRCNDHGRVAGAVNGIKQNAGGDFEGGLFDGKGFVASLDYFKIAYQGMRILVIGAGGGASALAAALAISGDSVPAEIALYDLDHGKAKDVAARIMSSLLVNNVQVHAVSSSDPDGYDLVVNASPLGMRSMDPLPCDVSRIKRDAAVVDILMKNQPTPFLQAARARGISAQPGFEMLIQQAPDYLDFFGYSEAANAVRNDATFIRDYIYPANMTGEIRRPVVLGG